MSGTEAETRDGLTDAVADALARKRHRVHWAHPGLGIGRIQEVLRDRYSGVTRTQVEEALQSLGAVTTLGKQGEDTGVVFYSLPEASKAGTCSHCGAQDVDVLTWRQPGAKQTAICRRCAGWED